MNVWPRIKSKAGRLLWPLRATGLRWRVHELEQQLTALEAALAGLLNRSATRDRWLHAGDLRAFERRVYSQNGEDGIIEELLRRTGAPARYFVEFGAETGAECNCARLAVDFGWQGLFIEADDARFQDLAERYRSHANVQCLHARVISANVEELFAAAGVPHAFDLLSIDIDGNDYWVWNALRRWRPRVVVIEYNAAYPPPQKWVMRENPDHHWDGTDYHGASLASLAELGRSKGYLLVGTNATGVNAFFVAEELAAEAHFLDPVVCWHYSPPGFGLHGGGHPRGDGACAEGA
jgi:hypothetical protein